MPVSQYRASCPPRNVAGLFGGVASRGGIDALRMTGMFEARARHGRRTPLLLLSEPCSGSSYLRQLLESALARVDRRAPLAFYTGSVYRDHWLERQAGLLGEGVVDGVRLLKAHGADALDYALRPSPLAATRAAPLVAALGGRASRTPLLVLTRHWRDQLLSQFAYESAPAGVNPHLHRLSARASADDYLAFARRRAPKHARFLALLDGVAPTTARVVRYESLRVNTSCTLRRVLQWLASDVMATEAARSEDASDDGGGGGERAEAADSVASLRAFAEQVRGEARRESNGAEEDDGDVDDDASVEWQAIACARVAAAIASAHSVHRPPSPHAEALRSNRTLQCTVYGVMLASTHGAAFQRVAARLGYEFLC